MPLRRFLLLALISSPLTIARAQELPAPAPPPVVAPANGADQAPQNGTSENNRNSPVPPESTIGDADVNAPIPTINGTNITPDSSADTSAPLPLNAKNALTPYTAPANTSAPIVTTPAPIITTPAPAPDDVSGQETPGGQFNFTTPNGVIYDGERGLALAQGDVTLTYREFTVRGRRGVLDYNTNTAILSDNLTVIAKVNGEPRVFTGESLRFDIDSGVWTLSKIQATFPPELFPPGEVLEPLYIRNGNVVGNDENVRGENFTFSSCDRDHYFVRSKKITFYRDPNGQPNRIVLKKNALYVFGRKILPLPVYVLSLSGQRSRRVGLQPTVGQNSVDGFFAKTVYDLAASNRRTDSLLVDVLQKRGLGLGLQRELAGGAGLFYLYALSGKTGGRQIDTRIRRNFKIADGLRGDLNFTSTQNNSQTGQGYNARSGTLNFNYATGTVQSSLLLAQNENGSPFTKYSQQSANFNHRQKFGDAWDIQIASLFNSSSSSGSDRLSTLDNSVDLNRRGNRFDALLRAELHDDLTGRNNVNGANQLQRFPELSLTSDSGRLGLGALNRYLPGAFRLEFGSFNEPSTAMQLNRTNFQFQPNSKTISLLQSGFYRSNLEVGGEFRQAFYSDDAARYDYNYDITWNNGFGRPRDRRNARGSTLDSRIDVDSTQDNSRSDAPGGGFDAEDLERQSRENFGDETNDPLQLRVNYLKLRTFGFTPFQFDFVGPNQVLDVRGIFQPSRKLRLEVAGGRDIDNGFTRDISTVLRLAPSRAVDMRFTALYSIENAALGDITADLFLRRNRRKFAGGAISVGLRYSAQNSTLSNINSSADLQLGAKTRFQALVGYNGFAKQFDLQQFRVVRDLHCFNLFATYDGQRKEFRLDLALKAFPFVDTRLGQNQFGTGFDPTIGSVR